MTQSETARNAKAEWVIRRRGVIAFLALVGIASTAHGLVGGQRPAAILVFPEIAVQGDAGEIQDTEIELINSADHAVAAMCFYVNGLGNCSADQLPCADDPDCINGQTCVFQCRETDFIIQLTPRQVVGWRANQGLVSLPCNFAPCGAGGDTNRGLIPPVSEVPFHGKLKCVELSTEDEVPPLVPVARNDLLGKATIIKSPAPGPDVSAYTAIGIEAVGPNNGDKTLCLGQDASGACAAAEYAPCPGVLTVNHFFDGAMVEGSVVHSSFVLLPCSEDFLTQQPVDAGVLVSVRNEFEQLFSLSRSVSCWKDLELASDPIFSIGVQGTLTGQSRIQGVQPDNPDVQQALLGVVNEAHDFGGNGGREADYHLSVQGLSAHADIIQLPPSP